MKNFSIEEVKRYNCFGDKFKITDEQWYRVINKMNVFMNFKYINNTFHDNSENIYDYIREYLRFVSSDEKNLKYRLIFLIHSGLLFMFGEHFRVGIEEIDTMIQDYKNKTLDDLYNKYLEFINNSNKYDNSGIEDSLKNYLIHLNSKLFCTYMSDLKGYMTGKQSSDGNYLIKRELLEEFFSELIELRKYYYDFSTPKIKDLCKAFGVGESTYRRKIVSLI